MDWLNQLQLLGHVALAGLLGGLIGAERERAHKPAGLRTHILVAAAAALLVQLGYLGISHFGPAALPDGGEHQPIRADPIRIMQAIILGISFLGAGTILRERDSRVEGLTTAATILLTATVGITTALRQYLLAAGVTVLALLVLTVLGWLERRSRC